MPATIAAARAGRRRPASGRSACATSFGSYRAPTGVGEAAAPPSGDEVVELRDEVARVAEQLGRGLKILVGKPGLDGHSNGAEQIAVRARDAGMEVVYEGIRLTPAQIARSAVDEGVHVIGLSILSGSHRELIPDVLEALREAGGGEIPVVVGGIIPEADADAAAGGRASRRSTRRRTSSSPASCATSSASWRSATGSPPRREPDASAGRQSRSAARAARRARRALRERDLAPRPPRSTCSRTARRRGAARSPRCSPRSRRAGSAARRPRTSSASPGRPARASRRC